MYKEAKIFFKLDYIDDKYDRSKIWIAKVIDDNLSVIPTFINNDSITSDIIGLGSYVLVYNEDGPNNTVLPSKFGIISCYPNPFNPVIKINYSLIEDSNIKLIAYNILGQQVKVIENGFKPIGNYTSVWDGTNNQGNALASGVYFIEINNLKSRDIFTVTLLK